MRAYRVSILAVVLAASAAFAADIKIEGEAKVDGNKLVRLQVPAPEKSGVIWDVWPDGKADVEEIPGGKLIFTGPAGEYTVKARVITSVDGGIKIDSGKVVVTIGKSPRPPPTDPPVDPPTDPTDPPTTPTGPYYFLVIRPDGPADPAFTKIMSDPAWGYLTREGHQYKAKTVAEAAALNVRLVPGTVLPAVVTLKVSADGKSSKIVRDAVPLPTTHDGIRNLPEGVQ